MNEPVRVVESVNYHVSLFVLFFGNRFKLWGSGFSLEAVVLRVLGTVWYCRVMYGDRRRDTCTIQMSPHFGAIPNT